MSSGQRSSNSEGTAESVAAGCSLREVPSRKRELLRTSDYDDRNLLCFTWGRGEDGYVFVGRQYCIPGEYRRNQVRRISWKKKYLWVSPCVYCILLLLFDSIDN